ncbi:MAG: helix-turn-helix transcriptional regulator [Clostridia bacterium]|nr:helix-turn-helix transcriptional regulator [Clostridia bacterium]
MIHQNLLTGNKPYEARLIGRGKGFPNHTHYEIEIIYVFENAAHISVCDEEYTVSAGEAIFIGSMVSHSYRDAEPYRGLLIEIGPVLLRDKFKYITQLPFEVKTFKQENPEDRKILALLHEISEECQGEGKISELIIHSSLYRLFAYVVENITETCREGLEILHEPKSTSKIDPALELIHQRYQEPITVEAAAAACGYGKSNFSKVFKSTLGVGFHQYLINYRLENAKYLLTETKLSIYQISDMVGFSDPKIFCRVFKNNVGTSPAQFRKDLFNKLF